MEASGQTEHTFDTVAPPEAEQGASHGRARLRRAALPHELLVPRRGQPSRGAGRGSGTARASPALAVTDHDGLYGVVRFAGGRPAARPAHRVRRRAHPRRGARPPNGHARSGGGAPRRPRRRARVGYARLARAISEAQMRGEKGAPRLTLEQLADAAARPCTSPDPGRTTTPGSCSPAAARARCPRALRRRRPGRGASARSTGSSTRSGATGCSWSCGTTATRSTGHRNDALAAARRPQPGWRWWPPTTSTTPRPTARRLATALAADPRPAARSTSSTAGCPPAPFAHLRSAGRAAPALRPLARRGRAHRRDRARRARSTCGSPRRTCPTTRCPHGHTEMSWLRELAAARRGDRATRRRTRSTTQAMRQIDVRARGDRAARLPRLLPAARTTSSSSAASTTSTARAGGARRTARSATRSASPRPTRSRSACCSSGSSPPSATARPTSTSTSSTSAGRR